MRIGIDCRMWFETGIGRYIRNIVFYLSKTDTKNEYVLFVLEKDIDKIRLPLNFTKVPVNIHWYSFAEQLHLPFIYYRQKLDVLFVPNLNVPILYLKKFVVTVHDLTVLHIKTGKASKRFYPYYLVKRFAVNLPLYFCRFFAKKIFVVSNFVKEDYVKNFGVSSDKILHTPCAVSDKFQRVDSAKMQEVLRMYDIKTPYIFYVGNAHPHKNIPMLINAFKKVKEVFPGLWLVLGGKDGFFYQNIREEFKGDVILDSVKFTGFILDEDLPALYSGSKAFVNPSLFEGFGIQILEAFACGTKVVCSNTTSLPEVGGNIAYYFNPRDAKDMAEKIVLCLRDDNPARIEAGLNRVNDFSWESSAKVIHEACTSI